MAKYKIEIDRDLCIGCGACCGEAPGTLEMDEENITVVRDTDGSSADEILQAAQVCPVDAIVLTEIDGGKKVWPEG